MTLKIDREKADWMYQNLPRNQSISDFVNEGLALRIASHKPA